MRSRYTAYAVQNRAYLLATWHPSTRPKSLVFDPAIEWLRLEILGRTGGGMLDSEGTVEFRADYQVRGQRGSMHEHSRFVRDNGNWVYLDAITPA